MPYIPINEQHQIALEKFIAILIIMDFKRVAFNIYHHEPTGMTVHTFRGTVDNKRNMEPVCSVLVENETIRTTESLVLAQSEELDEGLVVINEYLKWR